MFFPQLYTITSYSLLQSTIKIDELVKEAKAKGYTHLGISDQDVLHGTVEFYQACQAAGIRPLIGLHLTYTSQEQERSLLLYAKNLSGYQQLLFLSSEKMIQGKLDFSQFKATNDLYVILPPEEVVNGTEENHLYLLEEVKRLSQLFGPENTKIGLTPTGTELDSYRLQVAKISGLQEVAVNEVRTLHEEERFALSVMEHIKSGTSIDREERRELQTTAAALFLPSQNQVVKSFEEAGLTEAVVHAQTLAESIQFDLPLHQKLLPHYPLPDQKSAHAYLKELCEEKLLLRVSNPTPAYHDRLAYELSIIHDMGFDDYFLIVWDVMDFVHRQKIVTGAGRGSAAGSLVAYVLGITDVDPLTYDLLFERFLNPERYTMPDIDLDIPDNRREEVLAYVREKYGQYHMSQIATFGTMAAKMVLRDVSRVFGLSQSEANRWSRAIPSTLKITLEQARAQSARLREMIDTDETSRLLYETAAILEGLPRHVSTHAAGVVISDQNLMSLVPLQAGSEAAYLTQFTMTDVETVGLLKMDFLGLRNLSIIDNTLKAVKRTEKQELDLKKIPLDDPKTLQLFQRGETSGIFQFESAGIRNVLRRLSPESIEDIAAVNALYRPGPMQMIDTFIKRKKGEETITYPDSSLIPILQNTYGVIVYQEQIMQVAAQMAGFSLGQADILRRAISKKKKNVIDQERTHFVDGAIKQGYPIAKAEEVYNYIERFADYGFNRSHAVAYSFVGFQMAFLKVHYPGAFFTAILNSVKHTPAKVKEYMAEAKKNQLTIKGPSINQSGYGFQLIDKNTLLFGFTALRGVRRDFVEAILTERKEHGAFQSLDQFLIRLDARWLKEDYLIPLISVGAFDALEPNRKQLLAELDGKIQNVQYSGGSMDLLGIMALKQDEGPDFTLEERLELEEMYLGVYLSGHPTEGYERLRVAKRIQQISELVADQPANLLFYIRSIREIRTKKGELMAFVDGTDSTGEISATFFPALYRNYRSLIHENAVLYIEGKVEVSKYNQELQLIVEKVADPKKMEEAIPDKTCYLKLTKETEQPEIFEKMRTVFQKHPGGIPVILYYAESKRKIVLNEEYWVSEDPVVLKQLQYLLGEENVVFK